MPTTNTTQSTNQYNPVANSAYNTFQPQIMSSLMQMAQNPLGNSYFQHQLSQQQAAAQQVNQRGQTNALQNLRAGGGVLSNSGGIASSLINRNQIQGSTLQANAFNSAMNSALQNRNMALMSMQAYQPLQTGNTTTQSQSGLGTWLPQVAGMAMNMVAPGFSSMLGGNSFSAGYAKPQAQVAAPPAAPAAQPNPWYNNNPGGLPY